MDKHRKAKTIERMLFVVLLCVIGAGGFVYERFRADLPGWQLIGLIVASYVIAFGIYRLALSAALRKLR